MNHTGEPIVPDYSRTPRDQVPALLQWRIEDLYKSPETWDLDLESLRREISCLEPLVSGWTTGPSRMLALFELVDRIWIRGLRLAAYASSRHHVDLADSRWTAAKGEIETILVEFQALLAFRDPDLLTLGGERFGEYLKEEPALAPYRFTVERVLRLAPHVLPPEQGEIVSRTGLFGGALGDAAGILTDVDLPPATVTLAGGEAIILDNAAYVRLRGSEVAGDRSLVMRTYWENHRRFENTLAVLLNGEMKRQLFLARTQNYPDCLAARLFPEAIPEAVYHELVTTVRAGLAPLHRFLRLKKELLGVDPLGYEDLYAGIAPAARKTTTYEQAWELILAAHRPLGAEYLEGLEQARRERWIDVYANLGKESGAYSAGVYGVHPFILLNYNGDFDAVSTMAHELGHAMHSWLAGAAQPFADSDYPTFLAEIASTFSENLLVAELLRGDLDDLVKLSVLGGHLERIRATVYRQTLFAEFERDMHRRVEAGNSLTPDWLNERYLALTRHYYGHDLGVTRVDDFIQGEWGGIPHFFLGYYVFQYSTGLVASLALAERVLHGGPAEAGRYLDVLRAGGSDYPLAVLKKAGLDMATPEPTRTALNHFDNLVGEMEKLVEKLRASGRL